MCGFAGTYQTIAFIRAIRVIRGQTGLNLFCIIRIIFYAYAEVEDVDLVHLPNCWLNIEKYELDNSFDFSLLQVHQNLLHGLEDIGSYPHDLVHFFSPLVDFEKR
jgi:hypothetical protein